MIAAKSQYELAKANGKVDITGTFNYDHVSATNTASLFGSFQIPIFNRNQGEIARTNYAINQAQELELAANDQVMSDVLNAYESVRDNDQVVSLYRAGYLDAAKQSRDITRILLQTRRRKPAGLSRCRAQLPRYGAGLSPVSRGLLDGRRAASRSRRSEEFAMSSSPATKRSPKSYSPPRSQFCSPAAARNEARIK